MFNLRKNKNENVIEKKLFLKQIFLYFLVPIVVILFSTILVYNSYKNLFQNELKANYIANLSALSGTIDNELDELQNTTLLLSSDSNLYDIFYKQNKLNTQDYYKIISLTNTLLKFKATKTLIDSVYILHKESNEVLDTTGTYSTEYFYTRADRYGKYSNDFWMNFKVSTNFYQLLDPSSLESTTYYAPFKRNVIPFVTSNIESFKSKNLLVINISESEVSNLLNKYKFIPSSKLCMINRQGTIFSTTDPVISGTITHNKAFLSNILNTKKNFFEYEINGSKNLVVSFSSSSYKFNDFIYVAFIPYNDFYQKLVNIKWLAYLIIFLGLFISIILSYFMSQKIYSPISNLVNILKNNNPESTSSNKGEIEYLNDQIKKIFLDEDNLRKDLSIVKPLAAEQYLINILTNKDFLLDANGKSFIEDDHINFKYTDFCVSLIELNFTEKYYDSYGDNEYLMVRKGISKLLESIALKNYPTYVLNLSKNRLCILINLPKNENLDNISLNIKNVIELFDYDSDLLTITGGIGRTYSNYIGMNQSYSEALKTLVTLNPLGKERFKIYSEANCHSNYHYSINDENKIFNYLNGCYKEEALSFLNLLIEKNYQNNPSETMIKRLYSCIYDTIARVLAEKKINVINLMGNDYIDVASNIEIISTNDFNKYIFTLVNKLLMVNKVNSKLNIIEIVNYIKDHYREDIYLEKLSTNFNTSDKYLSKLFKESLGIGFHEYLTSLRITKSKSLLIDTNLNVTKIGEMVGFNTHSTFFRIFKTHEGINPTQYRDNNKKD